METGQINRYNVYIIVGDRTAVGNSWLKANNPEQLNRMINERAAHIQRGTMFHAIVFQDSVPISAQRLVQATAIAFKNRNVCDITFVKPDWNGRFLIDVRKANTSANNLVIISNK